MRLRRRLATLAGMHTPWWRPNRRIISALAAFAAAVGSVPFAAEPAPAIAASTGPAIVPVVPGRILETRSGSGDRTVDGRHQGGGVVAAGSEVALQVGGRHGVPGDAVAVMLNVTAVGPDGAGFLTVYPCGSVRPLS